MLTPRENFLNYFKGAPCEWTPTSADQRTFRPAFISDHVARGMVAQQEPYNGPYGGVDIMGCDWEYEELAGGSMEKGVMFEDIEDWREHVVFPNLDNMDWEGCAKANAEYLETDKLLQTTIYSGFFERLISFVGFEQAAIALVDPEQKEEVAALFDKLADLYIDLIGRFKKYFGVELVEIHDDWGTQRSPIFSVETHRELLVPCIKKIVSSAHERGVCVEMHSCGLVEKLIPNLISTGVDTWRGQAINDKHMLVDTYGDQFRFGVEIRPSESVDDDTAMALVKKAYEEWKGKNIWLAIGRPFTPKQKEMMTDYIRAHGLV